MFVRVENVGIESKFKRGFEKGDMHVVIIIESTTIVSLIHAFQPKLIPMFFHMDSIKKFKSSKKLEVYYHCCHRHWCKGIGDNKGEKTLLITNKKDEFDQDLITFGNNFRTKHQQLLEA
jgi:hypothetical protein